MYAPTSRATSATAARLRALGYVGGGAKVWQRTHAQLNLTILLLSREERHIRSGRAFKHPQRRYLFD
jgi:hypothetical protein